jgi:recombination protein RecT
MSEEKKEKVVEAKPPTAMQMFQGTMKKYESTVSELLGTKYGISANEFMVKVINAVKKTPKLLECSPASLFGSILYFAEVGLPFNTPEGFGYILPFKNKDKMEATPIIGYKGLVEIAYRNPNMKSIRVQAVYDNDEFDYAYGTDEYLKHIPATSKRGNLKCVYAMAKMNGVDPLFVVVQKDELDKIKKMSKSGNSSKSAYNNGTDVFNIMESKAAIKLLFKTLPKTDNDALIKVLELDNKFDYDKNTRIQASDTGYELIEEKPKPNALEEGKVDPVKVAVSEKKEAQKKKAEKKEEKKKEDNGELFDNDGK